MIFCSATERPGPVASRMARATAIKLPHLPNVTSELVFETHQLPSRAEKIPVTTLPRNIGKRVADIGDQRLKLAPAFHLLAIP